MKISRVTVWQMTLPLSRPYSLSGGRLKVESLDTTFVRLDTDEGVSGWGEGCPWGHTYLPAHGVGLRAALTVLGPALLGQDPRGLDDVNRLMDVMLPGHASAKSPLDIACLDILGKSTGQPLWRLLGAATPAPVPLNSSISTGTPAQMIADIERARQAGYRTHSAKIGGTDSRLDIERIEAIDGQLQADENVTFDVNRAWTPSIAVQVLNSVASRAWVEQPCETIEQCAFVARKVPQPILLDESLQDFNDHLRAWGLNAFAGLKIKPNRLGGLSKARRARDFSAEAGWRFHIEDVGGTAFADTAALHLAAAASPPHLMASWLAQDHLAVDPMGGQGVRNNQGFGRLPSLPGVGVTPDADALGEPEAVYQ